MRACVSDPKAALPVGAAARDPGAARRTVLHPRGPRPSSTPAPTSGRTARRPQVQVQSVTLGLQIPPAPNEPLPDRLPCKCPLPHPGKEESFPGERAGDRGFLPCSPAWTGVTAGSAYRLLRNGEHWVPPTCTLHFPWMELGAAGPVRRRGVEAARGGPSRAGAVDLLALVGQVVLLSLNLAVVTQELGSRPV